MPAIVRQDLAHRIPAIQQTMEVLRVDNDNNEGPGAVLFSRACLGCGTQNPAERHASLACGHAVCRDCASGAADACPLCHKRTRYVRLFEEESRECDVCLCPEPTKRGFFPRCGHIRCDACIARMWYNAMIHGARFACPHCDQVSKPIKLMEEVIDRVATPTVMAVRAVQESNCALPREAKPAQEIHATLEIGESCRMEEDTMETDEPLRVHEIHTTHSLEIDGSCKMEESETDRSARARTVS